MIFDKNNIIVFYKIYLVFKKLVKKFRWKSVFFHSVFGQDNSKGSLSQRQSFSVIFRLHILLILSNYR